MENTKSPAEVMAAAYNQDNMGVWDKVSTTDMRHTKTDNLGGRQVTSIGFQYMVMEATKMFGPIGYGWGWDVVEERFDEGATFIHASSYAKEDGSVQHHEAAKQIVHTLVIKLWYRYNGERVEMPPQVGHTDFISRTRYGASTDSEYYKKSIADAVKKSLSMLGFCADIFLGMADDQHYQQMVQEERYIKEQAERPEKIEELYNKVKKWCGDYKRNSIAPSLNAQHQAHIAELHKECRKLDENPERYINKLTQAMQERIEELKVGK